VSRFGQTGQLGEYFTYQAVLSPWLWFLTRTATCRIFQDMSVMSILKEVFGGHGFTDYKGQPNGGSKVLKYCVQYRETDFDFVSRLMEREGIYYYFEHENDKHTMVLADSVSAHKPFPGYEEIPFYPEDSNLRRERDHVFAWAPNQKVQTGTYALNDFDFMAPRANLQVKSSIKHDHAGADMEFFDYPGEYYKTDEGESYARVHIEEFQADHEEASGQSVARGMATGSLFTLSNHPRKDQNREYLLVATTLVIHCELYGTNFGAGGGEYFSCDFRAIPSKQPFRPARITPRPEVKGPQTAIVVGPAGNEIYTDEYGRVKVLFHWDRSGKADEKSSCWIRVAQVWAGAKWGAIHIPRIGQEVIVDFLEGDPDRPIITGRVYNASNMPPYELPTNMTQSGFKTKSSKGGGPDNTNELRFEDKKGDELLFIHAEKDQHLRTKHDLVEWVGNDSHFIVTKNQIEKTRGDKSLTVTGDHKEKVDGSVSLRVAGDIQEKTGQRYAMDAGQEIHLKAGMNVVLEAGMSISIAAGGSFIVVGPSGVTVSGAQILLNSGGSAGSGSGSSPEDPLEPIEPGMPAPIGAETAPPAPPTVSPQVEAFKSAAITGAPFCAA
jgi:type VI secretion system secreted protein VgrG